MLKASYVFLLVAFVGVEFTAGYSARVDARIIAEYKMHKRPTDHAKVARALVHQAEWAAVGTISTNDKVAGYPMVNIIASDDSSKQGKSTGKIHFLLTDLDFTGLDWKRTNKVTVLFSDEQQLNCRSRGEDPMEPTCARAMISGQVKEMDKSTDEYKESMAAFIKRHPAATRWIAEHAFYLCEFEIEHIFVLDYYGGPHDVTPDAYYSVDPDSIIPLINILTV